MTIKGCQHLGRTYAPGNVFGKGDSCNQCTCLESGDVQCTDNKCFQGKQNCYKLRHCVITFLKAWHALLQKTNQLLKWVYSKKVIESIFLWSVLNRNNQLLPRREQKTGNNLFVYLVFREESSHLNFNHWPDPKTH